MNKSAGRKIGTAISPSRVALQSLICRVGILIVLMLGTSCSPSGPVIKIEPSVSSIQVADTVRVSAQVENIADLVAYEVHLSFDADVLEVAELINGDFLKPDFVVQNTFDNAAGTIDYAVAQINRPPVNGSGTLFEIVFRAKTEGQSLIRFRETQAASLGALLSDSNGMPIQFVLSDGSVTVSDS